MFSTSAFATVSARPSGTGIAKTNLVKLHKAVKIIVLPASVSGNGPTKSKLKHWNGRTACGIGSLNPCLCGLLGFLLSQHRQLLIQRFMFALALGQ